MKIMRQLSKSRVIRLVGIAIVAIFLTCATAGYQRFGPEESSFGNLCGWLGSDLCYVPVLNAGFPFSFLVDKPYVSVPGSFDFDEFHPFLFVLDVLFFAIGITVTIEVVKHAKQTGVSLRTKLGRWKAWGVIILLVFSACFFLYQWQLEPALQPCGWLDIALGFSGCVQVFDPHTSIPSSGYTDIAFSRDAGILASSSFSEMISWPRYDWHSLRSGVRVWQISDTWKSDVYRYEWTTEPLNSIALSADGMILATGSNYGVLQLWQLPEGSPLFPGLQHPDPIMDIAFSPDGTMIASLSRNEVRLWDVQDGKLQFLLERIVVDELPSELAFSPDGGVISDGVQLWSVSDGRLLSTLGEGIKRQTVAFSPDGSTLAVDGDDTEIELWQVSDGSLIRTFGEKTSWTKDLAFSPDGEILVSLPVSRKSLRLWRVSDGVLLRDITIQVRISSVAFLPNGELALGVSDGRVLLWEVDIEDVVNNKTLPSRQKTIHALVFSHSDPSEPSSIELRQTRDAIQERMNVELLGDVIVKIDSKQIVVELSNADEAAVATEMLLNTHRIYFVDADTPYASGTSIAVSEPGILLSGEYIIFTEAKELSSGNWGVVIQLTSVGGRILDTWAMANIGRFLVMVQNDSAGFSLPIVESIGEIPGICVDNTFVTVAANLTEQEARTLATLFNNSQLPIELELVRTE